MHTIPPVIRQQLTLFVPPADVVEIETIRGRYNPVQRALIDCHVTLCREDELVELDRVLQNLRAHRLPAITIGFGNMIRSAGGKGVLLPAATGQEEFQQLREKVLEGIVVAPRRQEAHITLMHPRNSACTDAIFEAIRAYVLPQQITFDTISLIEQVAGGPWRVVSVARLER